MSRSPGALVLALLSLAGADAAPGVGGESERRRLLARLSPELRSALERCLDNGVAPPLTPLRGTAACGGCNVALPMVRLLALKQRLGAAPCPRCGRIVYDPAWLERAHAGS